MLAKCQGVIFSLHKHPLLTFDRLVRDLDGLQCVTLKVWCLSTYKIFYGWFVSKLSFPLLTQWVRDINQDKSTVTVRVVMHTHYKWLTSKQWVCKHAFSGLWVHLSPFHNYRLETSSGEDAHTFWHHKYISGQLLQLHTCRVKQDSLHARRMCLCPQVTCPRMYRHMCAGKSYN